MTKLAQLRKKYTLTTTLLTLTLLFTMLGLILIGSFTIHGTLSFSKEGSYNTKYLYHFSNNILRNLGIQIFRVLNQNYEVDMIVTSLDNMNGFEILDLLPINYLLNMAPPHLKAGLVFSVIITPIFAIFTFLSFFFEKYELVKVSE